MLGLCGDRGAGRGERHRERQADGALRAGGAGLLQRDHRPAPLLGLQGRGADLRVRLDQGQRRHRRGCRLPVRLRQKRQGQRLQCHQSEESRRQSRVRRLAPAAGARGHDDGSALERPRRHLHLGQRRLSRLQVWSAVRARTRLQAANGSLTLTSLPRDDRRKAPGCSTFKIAHGVSLVGYDTSPSAAALGEQHRLQTIVLPAGLRLTRMLCASQFHRLLDPQELLDRGLGGEGLHAHRDGRAARAEAGTVLRDVPILLPDCGECFCRQRSDGSGCAPECAAAASRRNGGMMALDHLGACGAVRCNGQASCTCFVVWFSALIPCAPPLVSRPLPKPRTLLLV
eukprot:COSAG04_NODE_480_length_13676_cov_4.040657_8_plen_342_part_00